MTGITKMQAVFTGWSKILSMMMEAGYLMPLHLRPLAPLFKKTSPKLSMLFALCQDGVLSFMYAMVKKGLSKKTFTGPTVASSTYLHFSFYRAIQKRH